MEKKRIWKKKAKINISILVFFPTIIVGHSQDLIVAEKSVTENSTGEKEKWTNKEKDKEQGADSL